MLCEDAYESAIDFLLVGNNLVSNQKGAAPVLCRHL